MKNKIKCITCHLPTAPSFEGEGAREDDAVLPLLRWSLLLCAFERVARADKDFDECALERDARSEEGGGARAEEDGGRGSGFGGGFLFSSPEGGGEGGAGEGGWGVGGASWFGTLALLLCYTPPAKAYLLQNSS